MGLLIAKRTLLSRRHYFNDSINVNDTLAGARAGRYLAPTSMDENMPSQGERGV